MGHFTLDNASNNKTMMEALEIILKAREIDFDAKDRRIMCFAHIINLCSGQVIRAATGGVADKGDTSSSGSDDSIVAPNYIAQARAAVRAIRGSGTRRDAFEEVIANGNEKGWFRQGQSSQIVQVKQLQLLRDVRTRWDSVHHMLKRLREMRPVCLISPNAMPAN